MRRAHSIVAIIVVSFGLCGGVATAGPPRSSSKTPGKALGERGDPYFNEGQKAFDDGSLLKAVEALKMSIASAPSSRAWLLLGSAYLQLGQLDEARKAFDETLKLERRGPQRATVQKLLASLAGMAKAKMRIESTPPGATVYIDLKAAGPRGKTPVEISVLPGRHRIIYSFEGYDDALAVPDPVAIEGQEIVVDTTMRRKGCDVLLIAKQKAVLGALDGDEQFPLPTTVRVTPGKHEVVLSGRGLAPKAVGFECADFKALRIEESLSATPGGLVHVRASAGYNIYVDGRAIPVEEAANLTLPPGPHDIEVEAPGNPPWHAQVTVRAGEQTEVTPQFTSAGMGITGLEVVPIPDDAQLWLDGKPLQPKVMTAVKAGTHLIEARGRGYLGFSRKLDMQPGEITRVEARLQRMTLVPLGLGLTFAALGVGAEATAITAYFRAGGEVRDSEDYKRWKTVELAGHITAGACAALAITGITLDLLQRRSGLERPRGAAGDGAPRVSAAAVPMQGGGSLVLMGSF